MTSGGRRRMRRGSQRSLHSESLRQSPAVRTCLFAHWRHIWHIVVRQTPCARVCVGASTAAASVLPLANAAKAGLSASLDSLGMEAALMSRPLPVLPPLLRPLLKQRQVGADGAPATVRTNSGRLAGDLLRQQKLDHGGAGPPAAANVPTLGSPKAGVLPGKHGLQSHRLGGQADSAGQAGSGTGSGGPGFQGSETFPASTGGSNTQPVAERVPVKSVMGTEASKLAARLAKLTGEAGLQLATTGRAPPVRAAGDAGMQLPGTGRAPPTKAPGGGAASSRPGSASSAGARSVAVPPSRNMRR